MGKEKKEYKNYREFSKDFRKEVLKLDEELIKNKFIFFDSNISSFFEHLGEAQFIALHRVAPEAKDDKFKELNLLTGLSFELTKAIKKGFMALTSYVSLANTMYKPMHLLVELDKYQYDSESIKSLTSDMNEMLDNIKPIFKSFKNNVESDYQQLKLKIKESQIKDSAISEKDNIINQNLKTLFEKEKAIIKTSKILNKFKTPDYKRSEYADIYVRVLRRSNKKPTLNMLFIASNNKISESTWRRKLKHTGVLDLIIEKISNLLNDSRIKNEEKKTLYKNVVADLYKIYSPALRKKFEIDIKRNKKFSSNSHNEEDSTSDY